TLREEEISERVRLLIDLARRGRRDYVRRWIGRELEVLIERGNPCRGISENYLKLLVQCNGEKIPRPGAVLRCVLQTDQKIENEDYDAAAIPCIMEQV
ncbi:MAG: hypothetical protein LBG91_03770, partial [Treponema sp.]|nr:hypothetical protein [Treponema sp.]